MLLVQDYVPARGGAIMRVETLGGKFLYAIEVESSGDSFDLCPADACLAQPGRSAVRMNAVQPPAELVEAAERIAQAVGLDVGGVEYLVDDRDGTPLFYDINACPTSSPSRWSARLGSARKAGRHLEARNREGR